MGSSYRVLLVQSNNQHKQPTTTNQMIIKDQETTLETIGSVSQESQFKMRTSQKAFQILSSLYSDKPLAIVRELGCNAMDSHIANGQPNRPFNIHIPNALEPWLTIQDFGTGISHENIYEIYSVYFASTKTNTNSQVGMLGLGSKSPFCYTDNFTITSIHNQVKRIYNAYFNAQGMPTISLASQENTKDENGVAIQIPIKANDFSYFTQSVFQAFRFFDVKPNITGGSVDWRDKADFEGSFWKSYTKLNQSYAVMGGVTYPIDTYKISSEHYDIVRKAGLVIKFGIGELDVTPSREALMYHDWVLDALNAKIELVKKDFVTKVEETIKSSTNLLDAMKALFMLNNQWSFLNSSMINGKVMWNKVEITDPRRSIKSICGEIKNYSKRIWGRSKWSESEYPALDNNALWYYDDLKRGSQKRIVSFVRNQPDSSNGSHNVSVNLVDQAGMKKLIGSGFPASIFIPTSTLPAVASNRASMGTKNVKPKGIITLYSIGNSYRTSWDSDQFDLATGTAPKYYIVKDSNSFKFDAMQLKSKDGRNLLKITNKDSVEKYLKYAGINSADVRMVSKGNEEVLKKLGSKSLASRIEKDTPSIDFEKIQKARYLNSCTTNQLVKHKLFNKLSDNNPFKIFVNESVSILKEEEKYGDICGYIEEDKKNELTYPSEMVKLLYISCTYWSIGYELTLKSALEMEQTTK